jgi:hypothetical protein
MHASRVTYTFMEVKFGTENEWLMMRLGGRPMIGDIVQHVNGDNLDDLYYVGENVRGEITSEINRTMGHNRNKGGFPSFRN